jgi:DNA-binding HxlR family transcriptional regulator
MALFDLLGRRWTLRVLWELRDGAMTFRTLQARCEGMSSSVLNQRLRELREADIVSLDQRSGYGLTGEGKALLEALLPLHAWAARWEARADG